jgi:transglutaminase-like putative cysteine protease
MYDIKQFRPALYFLLLLGLTGFALAVEAPGLWILSIGVVSVHAWLVTSNRFRPFPRLLANGITLVALLFTFQTLRLAGGPGSTAIVTIGQFLVFLQFVKLFELRANRDYAQLLILSLLLMVAGAISTSSLGFGVLFVVYLFVSLYVCLLFHLKIENDGASAAQTLPREKLDEATLKQDQRFLARSMRRLAGLVSSAAIVTAVGVFLFFPRAIGAGMFGQLQLAPPPMTGFSEDVSLGDITSIAQNNEIVAQVQLWRNNKAVEGTAPLLLRGRTFDVYDKDGRDAKPGEDDARIRKWSRSPMLEVERDTSPELPLKRDAVGGGGGGGGGNDGGGPGVDVWRQKVSLRPTSTKTLFALPGLIRFVPGRPIGRVRFTPDDDTLATAEELRGRLEYEVLSRNAPILPNPIERIERFVTRAREFTPVAAGEGRAATAVDPKIAEYARRPDVSGADPEGRALAAQRPPGLDVADVDREIAANIERHLRTAFSYTLDLTSDKRDNARDPVVQFLYDWKKGHCEYFASAMVLMCQSLGMQARMVTGFKCDEYDANLGNYYVVRQSHAHAWVEVKTANGWQTFDPTSGNDAAGTAKTSAWQSVKHFFDWLEFKWAEKVVAYDGDRRENLINRIDAGVANAIINTGFNPRRATASVQGFWSRLTATVGGWLQQGPGGGGAGALLKLAALAAVVFGGGYWVVRRLRQRVRIRRRAVKIGLDNLPTAEQIRLAKQLGFYEELTTLLERRRITRPPHQTPAEFGDSLSFLPSEAYDAIRRLTRVFYSIRFGTRELASDEQRELETEVRGLEPLLGAK